MNHIIQAMPGTHAIDTSCGDGTRLSDIATALGIPRSNTWGVAGEGRCIEQARQNLGSVLYADPEWVACTAGGASLAIASSGSLGELQAATRMLATNGVLLVFKREKNIRPILDSFGVDKQAVIKLLTGYYRWIYCVEDMSMIIGLKREKFSNGHATWRIDQTHSTALRLYYTEESPGFKVFDRIRPSAEEVEKTAVELASVVKSGGDDVSNSPVVPLSPGHLGMVLASGLLDGLITLASGETVVIKGISQKEGYKASEEVTDLDDGGTQRKIVYSERAILKIRTINQDGEIVQYETERESDDSRKKQ